ncbi:MAG: DUF1761 domain-containing protein [Bacteroidota bacterium]|nr:DUF1761 domain-containing protein [Bacteroidota bacterium]MDP4232961.1 DUF1761 domain-containing protein [Bacteroidota bacterium]MDP4242005.1 DUF1761 domain-containing protein [Bacteroidota bacterium]MDP4286908.1 DUF1761 domain-containing protein [Bacteroidota bacterium]
MLHNINFIAVAIAAMTTFVIGGIWYSQSVFGGIWGRESGLISRLDKKNRNPAFTFGLSYALAFIAATVVARLVGPNPGVEHAIRRAAALGFGVAATSFGINYIFGNRSFKLWLVDAGYHIVQFAMIGAVLGLML